MISVINDSDEFSVKQTTSGHFIIFYRGSSTVADTAELAGEEVTRLIKSILISRAKG